MSSETLEPPAQPAAVQLCFHCHREGSETTPLLKCAKCKVALYCSKACQLADWNDKHKKACKKLAQDYIPEFYKWIDENSSLLIFLAVAIIRKENIEKNVLVIPFARKGGRFQIIHPLQTLALDSLPEHNFEFSHSQFVQGMLERRPEDKYFINLIMVPGGDLGDRTARPIQLTDKGQRVRIGEKVMAIKVVNEINEGNAAVINDIMSGWQQLAISISDSPDLQVENENLVTVRAAKQPADVPAPAQLSDTSTGQTVAQQP